MKKKKIGFAFNQGEIELLIDALEEFKETAPDAWFDDNVAEKLLKAFKAESEFYADPPLYYRVPQIKNK